MANASVPNVIMQITRQLCEEFDFDVIVASESKGYYDEEFKSFGGNIFVKPYKNVHFIKKGKQVFDAVSDVLKNTKYDIIHCQSGIENGPALRAAYKYGVPVRISHAHGTYLNNGKNVIVKLYKHMRMKMGVKYSTHRLACSDIAGQTLFLGKDFQNILNPIDLDYYSNIQKKPHEGIRLVQIGYYKRYHYICKQKNS